MEIIQLFRPRSLARVLDTTIMSTVFLNLIVVEALQIFKSTSLVKQVDTMILLAEFGHLGGSTKIVVH